MHWWQKNPVYFRVIRIQFPVIMQIDACRYFSLVVKDWKNSWRNKRFMNIFTCLTTHWLFWVMPELSQNTLKAFSFLILWCVLVDCWQICPTEQLSWSRCLLKWLNAFILLNCHPTCLGLEQKIATFKKTFQAEELFKWAYCNETHPITQNTKCPIKIMETQTQILFMR